MLSERKLYFAEMTVRFAVFESKKMEAVLEYVKEVIGKFREAKDHQPLMIDNIKIELIKEELKL